MTQRVSSLIVSCSIFCVLWGTTSFSVKLNKKNLKFKVRAFFKVTSVLLDVTCRVGLTLSLSSGDYIIKGKIAIAYGENHSFLIVQMSTGAGRYCIIVAILVSFSPCYSLPDIMYCVTRYTFT